jgi:hypothetical protein
VSLVKLGTGTSEVLSRTLLLRVIGPMAFEEFRSGTNVQRLPFRLIRRLAGTVLEDLVIEGSLLVPTGRTSCVDVELNPAMRAAPLQ